MCVSRVLADWCIGSAPLASASTRPEHAHVTDEAPPADCLQAQRRHTTSGAWHNHSTSGSHVHILALVHLQHAISALASDGNCHTLHMSLTRHQQSSHSKMSGD